jgi:hypothetical protein
LTGTVDCPYDIRVGKPNGTLFASGGKGSISAETGPWVTDGLVFYLQEQGDTSDQGTLAMIIASVQPENSASQCQVSGFATSSSPIRTSGLYGTTTLTGTAGCAYDIRVGSPDGTVLTSGVQGLIEAKTANWVTDGMTFYLQLHGDTTSQGTLATTIAKVQPGSPACTVSSFAADPIDGTGFYGTTILSGSVDCDYEIRVDSPNGPLLTTGGRGAISASTLNWVHDGMLFYLQAQGDSTLQGTLAVAKAAHAN